MVMVVVLNRLKEVGLTLNGDKCEFRLPRLTFFGHQVTQNGVELERKRSPQSGMQIRHRMPARHYHSWVWLNWCLSSFQTCPLWQSLSKKVEFKWQSEQQAASDKLKELITSTSALAYFGVKSKTRIVADASPVGLGAVLIQLQGVEWRVIAYASRGLRDIERRSSQTEREALTLVWAFTCTFLEGILN